MESKNQERITNVVLNKLTAFKNHPFIIRDDEQMQMLTESIRMMGVLVPAIAVPFPDGSYELISGHRRKHACKLLGIKTLPVIVRDVDEGILRNEPV